jgi:hypothetical protein
MNQVKIRLVPTWDQDHTAVTITFSLAQQLTAWEVRDLCEMLKARSGKSVRVVLPAEAACDWLDGWCEALMDAVTRRTEVQFVASRREKRKCGVPTGRGAQLQFPDGPDRDRRPR